MDTSLMKKNLLSWKIVRRTVVGVLAIYLLGIFSLFVYLTVTDKHRNWGRALVLTDWFAVSGGAKRIFLPSVSTDDQMIARFKEHRTAFEKLAKIHQEKCLYMDDPVKFDPREYPEVSELKQQIGLIRLQNGLGIFWFLDPYSKEAAAQQRKIWQDHDLKVSQMPRILGPNNRIQEIVGMKELSREMTLLQCRYGSPQFIWEKFPADPWEKGVEYFPVEPNIADGRLHMPNGIGANDPNFLRVLESLDSLPTGLVALLADRRPGCAYRKIESQWFLFVC